MNYEAIKAAMQAEIDDTKNCYVPCGPAEFVRDRLFKEMLWEEAAYFWSGAVSGGFNIQELDVLYQKLKAKDKFVMPAWGTYGT